MNNPVIHCLFRFGINLYFILVHFIVGLYRAYAEHLMRHTARHALWQSVECGLILHTATVAALLHRNIIFVRWYVEQERAEPDYL